MTGKQRFGDVKALPCCRCPGCSPDISCPRPWPSLSLPHHQHQQRRQEPSSPSRSPGCPRRQCPRPPPRGPRWPSPCPPPTRGRRRSHDDRGERSQDEGIHSLCLEIWYRTTKDCHGPWSPHTTVQYSTVQCSTVQWALVPTYNSTVQYSTVQYSGPWSPHTTVQIVDAVIIKQRRRISDTTTTKNTWILQLYSHFLHIYGSMCNLFVS